MSFVAAFALAVAVGGSPADPAHELGRLAKLAPAPQCAGLETLLGARDLDEASRRTALTRIRDLASAAAPPLSEPERALIADLAQKSSSLADPLLSRYAIVLGSTDFVASAIEGRLPGLLDATYVLERRLFATDPVAAVGRRIVLFPEATRRAGWSLDAATLVLAYGQDRVGQGALDERAIHEIAHAFTERHPSKHLFAGGFAEGWPDVAVAYVGHRLGFVGAPLEKTWENWRDGIRAAGEREHLRTRMPAEEVIPYGPAAALALRLVVDASGVADPTWTPLEKMLKDGAEAAPVASPAYLAPARFVRDVQRAFPTAAATDALSRWRFPLDAGSQKELDAFLARARQKTPTSSAEQWKADQQVVVGAWRVLGPIPVPEGRFANLEFDPLDAWNFVERDEVEIAGVAHRWRTDVPVDSDGVVQLGSLAGSSAPCVFYLRADLPPEAEGPLTFFTASDDECAVWLDGALVETFRGMRAANPDDPGRNYGRMAKGGGRVLAQVANYGGGSGFHLRFAKGTPFESSLRTEARAPDPKRRLAAVRRSGSMRVPYDLVAPLYAPAIEDGVAEIRAEAAILLGGRRNEPRAVETLLAAWTGEKDAAVSEAIRGALSELALVDLADSQAAHRWWREEGRAWREALHVEAELAFALGSATGGWYANDTGAHANQHVGHCFGGDPRHALSLVIETRRAGPYVLAVRYASPDGERKADVRVRLGEQPVAGRFGAVFPKTEPATWAWQEVALGVLPVGRYRVEIAKADGCIDLDVIGLRPTKP